MRMRETSSNQRLQYLAFGALSLGALSLTAISSFSSGTPFQRYFGTIAPLLLVALVAALGFVSLSLLRSFGRFEIFVPGKIRRGMVFAAIFATLFAIAVVSADYLIRFPKDMNVPPPQSLYFYPAIGYVVEVAFHHQFQLVKRHTDSVIRDPVLWKIVGANLLAPFAASHLRLSVLSDLRILLFPFSLYDPGTQGPHGLGPVFQLRPLILAGHDDTGWKMRDSNG